MMGFHPLKFSSLLVIVLQLISGATSNSIQNAIIKHRPQNNSVSGGPTCDCEYNLSGRFDGGCKISIPAPRGYKCECTSDIRYFNSNSSERELDCKGEAIRCSLFERCPSNCVSLSCCIRGSDPIRGDCNGYPPSRLVLRQMIDNGRHIATFGRTGTPVCLQAIITGPASTADEGGEILLLKCGDLGPETQIWDFQLSSINPSEKTNDVVAVKIINRGSGKCIDNNGGSLLSGAKIDQWTCDGGMNQQWTIVDQRDDNVSFQLRNRLSGKCLTVVDHFQSGVPPTLTQDDCVPWLRRHQLFLVAKL